MIDAKEFAVRISGVEGTVKIAGIILDEHGGDRESATRALIHFLREDNGEFRRRVGNTLLEQFRDFAPKILIGALNAGTPEEESRRAFAKELLVSFGQQAVRYLVPCLGDRELRESASEVLIKIGKPSVNTLLPVLDNDDPERVSMVKKTLVGIGKPAVKPAIKAMFSPKHGIAETAQEILIAIGRDALPELRSEREKIAGRRKTMKRARGGDLELMEDLLDNTAGKVERQRLEELAQESGKPLARRKVHKQQLRLIDQAIRAIEEKEGVSLNPPQTMTHAKLDKGKN